MWVGGPDGDAEPVGPPGARHPVWDVNSDRIVFSLETAATETVEEIFAVSMAGVPAPDKRLQLCSMRPDGTDVAELTTLQAQDQRPAIGPDGTIAFVSTRNGGLDIMLRDPATGEVSTTGIFGYRPWFSLDGRTLYHFVFNSVERHQVCAFDLASGESTPFDADDTAATHGPFADPGGECLLVHSNRSGRYQLWELPLDGSPMRSCTPEGFTERTCGHATRSTNGVMTFDA